MNPRSFDVANDDKIILTLVKLKRFTSTTSEHLSNTWRTSTVTRCSEDRMSSRTERKMGRGTERYSRTEFLSKSNCHDIIIITWYFMKSVGSKKDSFWQVHYVCVWHNVRTWFMIRVVPPDDTVSSLVWFLRTADFETTSCKKLFYILNDIIYVI